MSKYRIFLISFVISFVYFNILAFTLQKAQKFVLAGSFFYHEEYLKKENIQIKIPDDFEVEANSVISLSIDRNGKEKIIYSKNENNILPIASITKLMTALVVFDLKESYNFFQVLPISKEAAFQKGVSILKEGEILTVESLLYITLIESSNDAAFALAQAINEKKFMEIMNLYAKKIGMEKTIFFNSTGLNNNLENVSTAYEISLLVKYIKENHSEILEITKKENYDILNPNGIIRHTSKNTNILLSEYPEIIGGKTGWTQSAKGCLVILIDNPNEDGYFINVILGSDNRFEEMRKLISILI